MWPFRDKSEDIPHEDPLVARVERRTREYVTAEERDAEFLQGAHAAGRNGCLGVVIYGAIYFAWAIITSFFEELRYVRETRARGKSRRRKPSASRWEGD
jgi:hypothetical protein